MSLVLSLVNEVIKKINALWDAIHGIEKSDR